VSGSGYGAFWLDGRDEEAHRATFLLFIGPIPIDMPIIRHRCDVMLCASPYHVVAGTHGDNVRDRVTRGRGAVGEKNNHAKLDEEKVKELRRRKMLGATIDDLAKEFDIDRSNVALICARKTWRHVEG
jgi:hypothetical protein